MDRKTNKCRSYKAAGNAKKDERWKLKLNKLYILTTLKDKTILSKPWCREKSKPNELAMDKYKWKIASRNGETAGCQSAQSEWWRGFGDPSQPTLTVKVALD